MNASCPTKNLANKSIPEVALAILYREGEFLLQLRDDIPTILYPGDWTLFGGHLELNESPEIAVKREIWEEIAFELTQPQYFNCYRDETAIRHVFHAPLTVPLTQLNLQEGWDFALVPKEAIIAGQVYSVQAQQTRPLGPKHQRILLDFLEARLN
jgi:8-oxo-dGTP pyrophosphatase MutT (NUDIX family)